MRKIFFEIIFVVGLILGVSCEQSDLNLQTNPNEITVENLDPSLLLNNVQIQFMEFVRRVNVQARQMSRMEALFGPYTGTFAGAATTWNAPWTRAYSETLQDITVLKPVAEESELWCHLGMAQVLEAYTLSLLVDFFGNVPYTEAFQGNIVDSPKADNGQDLYEVALTLLDEAILNFQKESLSKPNNDLFYNGNNEQWIKMANTLKLKLLNQIRLVDQSRARLDITVLVNNNNLINELNDDFQYSYSTVSAPVDSRHPDFYNEYGPTKATYMSNYYMYLLKDGKGVSDPRIRYYFYRQDLSDPSGSNLPCEGSGYQFCYIGDGYWGRDHGDDNGVPGDNANRTTFGVYPAGGLFDDGLGGPALVESGAKGAGIFPLILSSFTNFIKAETALTLETPGNPRDLLEIAVRQSITKTLSFGPLDQEKFDPVFEPSEAEINAYVDTVLNLYDNAPTNEDKLDVIIKEYYLAAWGNGIEPYNNYRKLGMPLDMQNPQEPVGTFPRTVLYPSNYVNLNANAEQKPVTAQVFWDNNPADFIN